MGSFAWLQTESGSPCIILEGKMSETITNPAFRKVPKTGVIYVMGEAAKAGYHPEAKDWANLGQGAPEVGTLPNAPDRLNQIVVDPVTAEYSPVSGALALRESIAHLYNTRYRRGHSSQYTAENVAISPGGRAGLTRIAAALGNIHLGHFLPDYTAYEELLDIFKNFIPLPIILESESGFQITAERVEREIIGKGLGAILFSNPTNPTGSVIHGKELANLAEVARKYVCTVIADEFYSHYLYDEACEAGLSNSIAAYIEDVDQCPFLIVDGLTKNWRYPGLRLSWTLGPKDMISRIASAGSFLDGGAPHPIQKAALGLVTPEIADQEARAIQKSFAEKRSFMAESIQRLGMSLDTMPLGGFYCFPRLSNLPEPLNDGMAFFRKALEHRVITVPGAFFDVDPGKRRGHIPCRLKEYVRLSFGPSLDELKQAMLRLEDMISSFK